MTHPPLIRKKYGQKKAESLERVLRTRALSPFASVPLQDKDAFLQGGPARSKNKTGQPPFLLSRGDSTLFCQRCLVRPAMSRITVLWLEIRYRDVCDSVCPWSLVPVRLPASAPLRQRSAGTQNGTASLSLFRTSSAGMISPLRSSISLRTRPSLSWQPFRHWQASR